MVEKDHRSRDGPLVEPHELSAKERRRGRGPTTTRGPATPADPDAGRAAGRGEPGEDPAAVADPPDRGSR